MRTLRAKYLPPCPWILLPPGQEFSYASMNLTGSVSQDPSAQKFAGRGRKDSASAGTRPSEVAQTNSGARGVRPLAPLSLEERMAKNAP
jgi:hypothetical protein